MIIIENNLTTLFKPKSKTYFSKTINIVSWHTLKIYKEWFWIRCNKSLKKWYNSEIRIVYDNNSCLWHWMNNLVSNLLEPCTSQCTVGVQCIILTIYKDAHIVFKSYWLFIISTYRCTLLGIKFMRTNSYTQICYFYVLTRPHWLSLCISDWGAYVKKHTQQAFTCLKLTIETLEQGVKYVQS